MQVDYIIVGQGLMGSLLGLELQRHGQRIYVFDKPTSHQASSVSAGLYNPIAGRLVQPTWSASAIFQPLVAHYQNIERLLQTPIIYPMDLYRPFINAKETTTPLHPSVLPFIKKIHKTPHAELPIHNRWGGIQVQYSGYVAVKTLLQTLRTYWLRKQVLQQSQWDYDKMVFSQQHIQYQGLQAKGVIFCEGVDIGSNPLFNYLPLRPLLGELLEIKLPISTLVAIPNRAVHLVPTPTQGVFKLGATYTHIPYTAVASGADFETGNAQRLADLAS